MPNEWPGQMPEIENKEQNELTEVEKRKLSLAWSNSVLGNNRAVEGVEGKTDEEIKNWMYGSLMNEIDVLVSEWGIESNESLIDEIKRAEDTDKKSELELKYIFNCHKKVSDFVAKFKTKSTRWNSWPAIMRENASFNCVGATLVGLNLLEKANIKNFWGNPIGHVINIAKLSNGDLWYVDFLNGETSIRKIEPKIKKISETDVLEIDDKLIDYKLIPIYSKEEICKPILGNIEYLKTEAESMAMVEDDDKKIAIKFKNENFAYIKNDFSAIIEKIYGKLVIVDDSDEMRTERERIDMMFGLKDQTVEFIESLSKKEVELITAEAVQKIEDIRIFFLGVVMENNFSVNLLTFLNIYKKSLADIISKDRKVYLEFVNKLLFRIEEYKKQIDKSSLEK